MNFLRQGLLHRYLDWEHTLTVGAHRLHAYRMARGVFGIASRLGDGIGWYAVMAALVLLYGRTAWIPVGWMLGTAVLGFALYWAIKKLTARPRPCHVFDTIKLSVDPLDKYSFPSGHTLHAVNFSVQIVAFAPEFAWLVLPFATLVITSRMVLGLHYLSDVLAGASIGALLAGFALFMQAA
jgi:undecaprenyl-diphosphatase